MVFQNPFRVEQYMDEYEIDVTYNLGETCCYSVSLDEISTNTGNQPPLDQINSKRLTYGAIRGTEELKSEISSLYEGITNEDVVVTNGAIGANFLSIYSLVDAEDHVIVIDPTYEQLKSVPTIFKGEVSIWNLTFENEWLPNINELKKLVKSNTKLIIINNPNNPSGQLIKTETLQEIVDIAAKQDCYLLCDEVYRPLYHVDETPKSIVELYAKGISTSSLSKAFSAAGLRLGWIVSKDKTFIDSCYLRRDYNTISISVVDDLIGIYILQNRSYIMKRNHELCAKNIQIMDEFIQRHSDKISWVKPKAGTTSFVKLANVKNTYDLAVDLADNHKVLVVPGEVFDFPGFLRIGFGNSTEELTKGLEILAQKI